MKKLFTFFLLSSSLAHGYIIPAETNRMLVTDELFPYQWGLLNQGQTLIREKDDLHNLLLQGVSGKDIAWENLVSKLSERRPVIAVLDSGVDLNHPELAGNLWKNEEECGKDPKVDHDGNKLAGDCHGWNFTESIGSDLAKDPSDIDGHGTHIAGIIAALNNGTGMVGVSPNALIMPIKVMKDSNSTSDVPSSESFARGIIYAVDNGADVINMSLGWPRSLETKTLRDAVYYALGRGVPIIAAAGNNNSTEPLYPCAYDGVICVGATTINGKFASFSNFGGHVDTVAPGEGILGLNPLLLEPDFFSVPGFELRSGTSQAAPFVAAMVAVLKAKNKDLRIDDLFSKLYQAPAVADSSKYILGGIADWNVLNDDVTRPVLRPIFKKIRQLPFRADATTSRLPLTIRNFGLEAKDIQVKVESLSRGLQFSSGVQSIASLNQGEFKDLVFDVSLMDLTAESEVGLKVTISHDGESSSFTNEIPVLRDIRQDAKLKRSNFIFADRPLPLGIIKENVLAPLISTVESYGKTSKHEFSLRRNIREEKRIELTLFTRKERDYTQLKKTLVFKDTLSIVNLIRVDLNFDGKEDYIVQALMEKEGKKFFQYSFYNEVLEDLWPSFQNVKLNLDLFVENFNDMVFMKYEDVKLGPILVPAYFTTGVLPKVDQQLSSRDRLDTRRKKRLYYLEPNKDELRVRSRTTTIWEESLKTELKAKWFETVETEQILPPSTEDSRQGQIRALVSVGLGTKRQILISTFDTKISAHGPNLPQLVLQTDNLDPLLSLTPEGLQNNGDVFFNIYDRTRAKLVTTRKDIQTGEFIFRHETESDIVAGHISTFENGPERFSVVQTREELISLVNGVKKGTRPKLRYSFLSQRLLSEMYYPVTYKRNGQHRPALYVDATSVTGNRIYLFEEQNGELVSSIKNSLIIPGNCKSLNPAYNLASASYEFIFLCLEDKDFVIRSLEMN
jgi:cell wall-associated protease